MSTSIPGHFDPEGTEPDLFSARPAPLSLPQPAGAERGRLHKGHFAFMRAVVQGVDWQVAWERYLRWEEEGGDLRAMRATIAWLRDEFAAAARREARFGTARLVLLDASRVQESQAAQPSLEDFVEQRGLEDFPQAEQIALYESEFGRTDQRQRRRARLIARQLEALNWIELQVAQPPRPGDSVAYWLNPLLAAPLQQAGLDTLARVRADIDGRGSHWYRRLHGIGATKAARIEAWLDSHQASLVHGPSAVSDPVMARRHPDPRGSTGVAFAGVPSSSAPPPGMPAAPVAPSTPLSPPATPAVLGPSGAQPTPGVPGAPRSTGGSGVPSAPVAPPTTTAAGAPTPTVALAPPPTPAPGPEAVAVPQPPDRLSHPVNASRGALDGAARPSVASPGVRVQQSPGAVPRARDPQRPRPGAASPGHAADPPIALPVATLPVRPLDRFPLPPALDGRGGSNRRPPDEAPRDMVDDRAAIEVWLGASAPAASDESVPRAAHTRRAYHREAERFLLWCVIERGKTLSSIDAADCWAYRAFLADPQPRDRWCVRPSPGRQSSLWRPFAGPLGAAGQRQAVAALSSLFSFLVDARYLWSNPWRSGGGGVTLAAAPVALAIPGAPAAVAARAVPLPQAPPAEQPPPSQASHRRARPAPVRPLDPARSLSPKLWADVLARADALPAGGTHHRLRFALRWLYATGLRLSEAVQARLGDLYEATPDEGEVRGGWWLRVRAGAGHGRELPLPDMLIDALSDYLLTRGLDADPAAPTQRDAFVLGQCIERSERAGRLPVPGPMDARGGVRASTLARQLKQHFGACAAACAQAGDADAARRLAAASAHWLRHTHARHLLANGLPLELARRHLGHAARSTTAAYLVAERPPGRADWLAAWDATITAGGGSEPAARIAAAPASTGASIEEAPS